MRGLVFVVSLGTAFAAAPAFAQAAAGQAKPTAPAAPRPVTPAPAPTAPPAQAQQPAPPPAPPAPFPTGAKVAYVNLQVIAQLSNDGKAAAGKVNALTQKKQAEIAEKTKTLQGFCEGLSTAGVSIRWNPRRR